MTQTRLQDAWAAYIAAEDERIRQVYMARLRDLIRVLNVLPEARRSVWAMEIAQFSVDKENPVPVRLPLFREVLFPALHSGFRRNVPGCARWLAGFYQLLYKSPECRCQLPPDARSVVGLLRAALRIDPADALSRSRLIREIQWQLEYSLHELPELLLYGNRGATMEDCEKLRADLVEFECLIQDHAAEEDHSDLIEECKFHYTAYAAFLNRRQDFDSYESYLQQA